VTEEAPLTVADLTEMFYQPFKELKDSHTAPGSEAVNQLRAAVEVMRQYLSHPWPALAMRKKSAQSVGSQIMGSDGRLALAASAAEAGLVGYWKFDEGAGDYANDSAPGGYLTLIRQFASWETGRSGFAGGFDGVNRQHFRRRHVHGGMEKLTMSTATSLCAWIYPQGDGSSEIGGMIATKVGEYALARFADGTIRCAFNNNKPGWTTWINSELVAPLNQWTHVAVVYDSASDSVKIYLNGGQAVKAFTFPGAGNIQVNPDIAFNDDANQFRVGNSWYTDQNFHGRIDEVRLYNRALSDKEIEELVPATPRRLVAYWRFDEGNGATTADATGNGHSGTLAGPAWTAGRYGGALSFDGVDDYVEIAHNPNVNPTGAISLSAWIFIRQYTSNPSIVSKGNLGNFAESYALYIQPDGKLGFLLNRSGKSGGRTDLTGTEIQLNTWTHIAATYNGATMTLYKDGKQVGSVGHSGGIFVTPNAVMIGKSDRAGTSIPTSYFNGQIDDVRLYNYALSAAEVAALAPLPAALVAHWTCEEGNGAATKDATGSGRDGKLIGPLWARGRFGAGLSFDGKDDYVEITNPSQLVMTDAATLCAWIYPQGPGTPVDGGIILNKENEYQIARYPDGSIRWAFANGSPGWNWINTGYVAPEKRWTHIAVAFENGNVKTYANGKKVHEFAGAGAIKSADPQLQDMRLGGRKASTQHFHGVIDDVRVYRGVLSAHEIAALIPAPPRLVAHWTFDEAGGTTAADATGNGNTGTLQDGTAWIAGCFGHALSFDGVDDRVRLADNERLKNLTDNFTIAFWARPQAAHEIEAESQTGAGGRSGQRFAIGPQQGADAYGSADHAGAGISVGTNGVSVYENSKDYMPALLVHPMQISDWTHVAVVYQDKQPSLYINGELVKTGLKSTKKFVHVFPQDIGGSDSGYYRGWLDDMRIYDQALPADALADLRDEYAYMAAEARYRMAAYQALLNRIGTFYEEIRLARGADAETRSALAQRLGISLEAATPDPLEQLYLAPEQITEKKLEELFGLADSNRNPLSEPPKPLLREWRIDYLRKLWSEQDGFADAYTQGHLPIIDPDLINPDDLRQPKPGSAPFDLWQARRAWVDARLQELRSLTKMVNDQAIPDLPAIFNWMYKTIPGTDLVAWKNTKPEGFDALRDTLTQSDVAKRMQALATIKNDLHLSADSFTTLLTIRDKEALAAGDPRNEKVTNAEWQELYSILAQAQKETVFPLWIAEEEAQKIVLGYGQFWLSVREPSEGDWPPLLPTGRPMIDPDVLKRGGLAEPTVGATAMKMWIARSMRLVEIKNDLKKERETRGFETMLRLALGDPTPGDPVQHNLDKLQADLNSASQQEVESATQAITNDLHLTPVTFRSLMAIRAKDAQTDPLKKPTAAEYAEVYATLLQARKIKHEFPRWIRDEQQAGLQYWGTFRAQLPRWRASAEARQQWQQALQTHSQIPIIDPDLIGQSDLNPVKDNPALELWQKRKDWLAELISNTLRPNREAQPTALAGFDLIVSDALARPIADLLELSTQERAGQDISAVLQQLNLSRAAFHYLMRARALAEKESMTEPDWMNVYHILVQVIKSREFADWREVERKKQMALVPDYFVLSDDVPDLPPWRATWQARLDWLDKLQARLDQLQTTGAALRAAVAAVEEHTLPLLRDALVMGLRTQLKLKEAEAADWLVHRLLIDVKTNASQRTTRLIQAIETVQGLLFALRVGQLVPSHPAASWKLAVDEGHFDEEWQWMGNYSTWRAANIVFFFPETVLLPSLREPYDASDPLDPFHRTKQFEALLKELRKRPRLTPEQARIEAGKYLLNLLEGDDPIPNFEPRLKKAIDDTRPSPKEAPTFLTDQHTDKTLGERRELCRKIFPQDANQTVPNYIQEIFYGVPLQLAWQLQQSGAYLAALDWLQTIYAYNLPDKPDTAVDERKIYYGLERETNVAPILSRSDHWLREGLNPHALAASRTGSNPHTRYTLMTLSRCLMDFADAEFTQDTPESLARARALYLTARRLLFLPDLDTPVITPSDATVLPNILLEVLRLRVEIQLTKMRDGRNVAGMKRQVELPISLPPGPSDLPTIGAGGQLILPGARRFLRPTPYYFRVLLERSKQLVNIAQGIEAAYLAALEKRDAENYNQLKASHDLQLATAGVELQNRRVHEAQAGVGVARAQQQRAMVVKEKYQELSSLGLNEFEQQMINSYKEAINFIQQAGGASADAARLGGMAALANAAAQATSAYMAIPTGIAGTQWVPHLAAMASYLAAGGFGMASGLAQASAAILSANAQVAQMQASIYGVQASHEWRKREFETQAAIAEQDILIGEAQVNAAQAHVGVADQERIIAQTQATQAQAVADFLAKKFTNADLYEWMSGVLGEVYAYFLQQATAIAQLAENQLAFERQDTPPKFIQTDYWEVSSDEGLLSTTDQKAPDRKGLTGSVRLLGDIQRLDQYAFETNRRKLNLSQTFSLSRMAPFDFEQFRKTGVLTFATPLSLFDQDFPGHYLRLINRVRVSVIALIPPHHGIRATLTASGISRVVTGGEVFQQIMVRRDPEIVALTSPISATGVFEMDTQSEMLLPFESMGVDTRWQFEMPRAANPFDFRTIADVLVTIEYTALNSFEYRQQVLKLLDPKISGERSFSFANQFADAWYDLHNPEQSATPMKVKFQTRREDFPPNVEDLKIEQVLLFFSMAEGAAFEVEVKNLRFTQTKPSPAPPVGAGAKTIDGVISTRRGNGAGWNLMIGKSPAGEWELTLPNTEEMKQHFKDEEIMDILLVITYGGRTPAWPA
jgi:hypothetical protein